LDSIIEDQPFAALGLRARTGDRAVLAGRVVYSPIWTGGSPPRPEHLMIAPPLGFVPSAETVPSRGTDAGQALVGCRA